MVKSRSMTLDDLEEYTTRTYIKNLVDVSRKSSSFPRDYYKRYLAEILGLSEDKVSLGSARGFSKLNDTTAVAYINKAAEKYMIRLALRDYLQFALASGVRAYVAREEDLKDTQTGYYLGVMTHTKQAIQKQELLIILEQDECPFLDTKPDTANMSDKLANLAEEHANKAHVNNPLSVIDDECGYKPSYDWSD